MLKYVGLGMMGLFVIMIFPAAQQETTGNPYFGGMATIVVYDANGNERYAQQNQKTIH